MHFAGLKAVAESVDNPLLYYTNNLTSTFILCRVMSEFKVKIMVFSSSATVYGIPASLPVSEDALLKAHNPYGQTKLMIEKFLSDLYKADNAWKIIILRYFNPIGAHSSGLIGENPIGTPNNLLPYISQVAIGRRKILSIYGNDYPTTDGTCIRDYIHIVDLVKGHTKALDYLLNETDMKDFKNTAINLGIGRGYSVLEILKAFEKACDFSIKYQYVERRQGDVPEIYSNPALAQKLLGWKAQFGIQEMCSDAWNWQTKNPNGFDD
jgi:UDP-glucose 4-epimerase